MPAFLHLLSIPAPGRVDGLNPDGARELVEGGALEIGRSEASDIVVRNLVIGGRRNCRFQQNDGRWSLLHLGHSLPIYLNGGTVDWRRHDTPLSDGDVIVPAAAGGFGPSFAFLVGEAGALRRDVLPAVERAVTDSFPARAGALIAEIRRAFTSEVLLSPRARRNVPNCLLCGRFREQDDVAELYGAGAPQAGGATSFRVAMLPADSAPASPPPVVRLCRGCFEDPDATCRRAADGPMLFAEACRALEAVGEPAGIRSRLEGRWQAAVPVRTAGRCSLCLQETEVLARGADGVCARCLDGVRTAAGGPS